MTTHEEIVALSHPNSRPCGLYALRAKGWVRVVSGVQFPHQRLSHRHVGVDVLRQAVWVSSEDPEAGTPLIGKRALDRIPS